MATTTVSETLLAANSSTLRPNGTTLVAAPTDDMRVVDATPEELVLQVSNTGGASLTFTVLAGDNPPAVAAGQGNLAVTVTAGTTRFVGPLESGRFIQSDGNLQFTSSLTTGTVTAIRVPRTA